MNIGVLARRKGFTLIELLIVVSIIGILASIVLVGLRGTREKARDTRRIADLKQMQNGIELYYGKCQYYPGTAQSGRNCGAAVDISDPPEESWDKLADALIDSDISVSVVPHDPLANAPGRNYAYATAPGNFRYALRAEFEDLHPALDQDVDGLLYGLDCDDFEAPFYYCIEL